MIFALIVFFICDIVTNLYMIRKGIKKWEDDVDDN